MGGDKAARELHGRPIVSYVADALAGVCDRVVVVAKADTLLPEALDRWDEPPEFPRHPLSGMVHALTEAGEEVLVCAADMPFVVRGALRELVAEARPPATVAWAGRMQPLLGVYYPEALPALRAAAPDAPLTATVESLGPWLVELPASVVRSIDTPEALAEAEREGGWS
jgi:molybdopterin-guanine dinucleotide biosynthesis protein A